MSTLRSAALLLALCAAPSFAGVMSWLDLQADRTEMTLYYYDGVRGQLVLAAPRYASSPGAEKLEEIRDQLAACVPGTAAIPEKRAHLERLAPVRRYVDDLPTGAISSPSPSSDPNDLAGKIIACMRMLRGTAAHDDYENANVYAAAAGAKAMMSQYDDPLNPVHVKMQERAERLSDVVRHISRGR